MAELTLVRCIGNDGFPHGVARWLREGADHARAVDARSTAEALEGLARYVEQRDHEDPTVRALYTVAGRAEWGVDAQDFQPVGEGVVAFRSQLGRVNQPTPEEALAELASIAVDDLLDFTARDKTGLRNKVKRLEAEVKRLERADDRATALSAENERLDAEISDLNSQLRETGAQIEFLKARGPEPAPEQPKASSRKTASRKVPKAA